VNREWWIVSRGAVGAAGWESPPPTPPAPSDRVGTTRGPGVLAGPLNQAPGLNVCPGPLAVRRLGRRCDAEGLCANRCLSEDIADVRGSCDSRPRRRASPSAAARAAGGFSAPFLAGQKGDTPFEEPAPTVGAVSHLPTLSLPLQGGDLRPGRLGSGKRLLPLEKGLGDLASVPDHSIKRPGQRLSRAFRGAASRTAVRHASPGDVLRLVFRFGLSPVGGDRV